MTARPISLVPSRAAVSWLFPHLQVAHDVLAHDDGVVDQQADRQRQREQRHGVHGEVEHPHDEERADDRDGQREPGDDRGAPRVQEQVDDHDREHARRARS